SRTPLRGTSAMGVRGRSTLHRNGRFIYVANGSSADVSAYAIDDEKGVLNEVTGSPYAAGAGARSVNIHRNGRYAYVENAKADTISAFSIDQTTGALVAISSPIAAGSGPRDAS